MRIVAIETHPSKQRGGSEKAFFEVLNSLNNIGHEVFLAYCHEGDLIADYESVGIKTFLIEGTNIQNWYAIGSFLKLNRSATRIHFYNPDIVYINYLSDSPIASVLKLYYGTPSICHIRVPYMGRSKQFSFCAKYVKAFIVLNQKMKHEYELKEHLKNIHVINDSIAIPNQIFAPNKKNAAVYLGRISPEKGIIELIKVWQILKDRYNISYSLDIIGPSHSAQEKKYLLELSEMIIRYKLDHIKLIPAVNNPIETLSGYHFAVMPSLWEEPFGRVIPESIMANTPIFARNVGITMMMLKPHYNELIFNTEDELAHKIFQFLKGDTKINMIDLQNHIVENYTINKNVKIIEQLLFNTIN